MSPVARAGLLEGTKRVWDASTTGLAQVVVHPRTSARPSACLWGEPEPHLVAVRVPRCPVGQTTFDHISTCLDLQLDGAAPMRSPASSSGSRQRSSASTRTSVHRSPTARSAGVSANSAPVVRERIDRLVRRTDIIKAAPRTSSG